MAAVSISPGYMVPPIVLPNGDDDYCDHYYYCYYFNNDDVDYNAGNDDNLMDTIPCHRTN
jgi:hypothetical protein